jgi:hypothetical protein
MDRQIHRLKRFGRMGEKEVNISARGPKKLENSRIEKDFTFLVGEDHYNCPWFIAEFLSPRRSQLCSNAITVNEFVIETKDPDKLFELILSIGYGSNTIVTETTFSFFVSIAKELFNWELYFVWHSVFQANVSVSKGHPSRPIWPLLPPA